MNTLTSSASKLHSIQLSQEPSLRDVGILLLRSTVKASQGLHECKIRCKPQVTLKNKKGRLKFYKTLHSSEKNIWTDETKISFHHNDKKRIMLCFKQTDNGGNVGMGACKVASGTGSLVFIAHVTGDSQHRATFSDKIEPKCCNDDHTFFTVNMEEI